ncbi:uncharacterized protein DC041_0007743 [Schistosoma bovis]|uniref:Dynein light chain 1, cytoplasmic n=1 Tax=Schistosoma bovis TaxID=6184 RepID=A0A430QBT2_SCHBO|nr:uncharacterized protein DC041_0007743 [Schistosoma bovis]
MSERKAVIKNADMERTVQDDAVYVASAAMDKYDIEKDVAAYIKKEFDRKYTPNWHCIVGKHFGSITYMDKELCWKWDSRKCETLLCKYMSDEAILDLISLGSLELNYQTLYNLLENMIEHKAVIKNTNMSTKMQEDAIDVTSDALDKYELEMHIAEYVKKEFDIKYNPVWHCIVGRNFGRLAVKNFNFRSDNNYYCMV